jgi:hypothetical protein
MLITCLFVCLRRYMYNILFGCLFIFVFEGLLSVSLFVYII